MLRRRNLPGRLVSRTPSLTELRSMTIPEKTAGAAPRHAARVPGRDIDIPANRAKKARAYRIIHRYMAWSGGVGLIPLPLLDQVLIGGLLAKMIQELCALYGVRVTDHKAKTIVAAVLGGAHAEWISRYLLIYLDQYLPGLNTAGRIVIRPMVSAATTYALGMLFVHHFDKGAWQELNFRPDWESSPEPLPAASKG